MEKQTDINLTNNEVKDILGTPPKWILRWGNLLLLLIMIIMITGSLFIRHPEMIAGTIEIMPVKKEIKVLVPLNVTIDTVLIKDSARITRGDSLLKYRIADKVYTVIAPQTGIVTVEQLLSKGQVIDQDSTVISIDPLGQTYTVKGIFPAAAINKIYPGQLLDINMNDYPKEDFGSLAATAITKPAPDSIGNAFINIKLNNNTITNCGKTLPIRTLARGTCYTMISNKRLIMWLLSK
jgi:hypothetical protein